MRPSRRPCTSVRSIMGHWASGNAGVPNAEPFLRRFGEQADRGIDLIDPAAHGGGVRRVQTSRPPVGRPAQIRTTRTSLTLRSAARVGLSYVAVALGPR